MMKSRSFSTRMFAVSVMVVALLASATFCVAGQRGGGRRTSFGASYATYSSPGYVYGGYSNYGSSYGYSSYPSGYSNLSDHWWAGPYSGGDPRGVGFNPDGGYAWESVTTLVLETFPAKARVTLDGIFVGTTDLLGPFQLPMGDHTLRVDAAGYVPSETVLKVEKPVVQQLMVRLSEVKHNAKAAPRK